MATSNAYTFHPEISDADAIAAMRWDGVDLTQLACMRGCCQHVDKSIIAQVVAQWEAAGKPTTPRNGGNS